jgi:hypothetical protein
MSWFTASIRMRTLLPSRLKTRGQGSGARGQETQRQKQSWYDFQPKILPLIFLAPGP